MGHPLSGCDDSDEADDDDDDWGGEDDSQGLWVVVALGNCNHNVWTDCPHPLLERRRRRTLQSGVSACGGDVGVGLGLPFGSYRVKQSPLLGVDDGRIRAAAAIRPPDALPWHWDRERDRQRRRHPRKDDDSTLQCVPFLFEYRVFVAILCVVFYVHFLLSYKVDGRNLILMTPVLGYTMKHNDRLPGGKWKLSAFVVCIKISIT